MTISALFALLYFEKGGAFHWLDPFFGAKEPEAAQTLLWGKRVVGLRVDLAKAKAPLVKRLLEQAWSRKAPKRLLAATGLD